MPKRAKKNVTSMPWPELDKIELTAHWLKGTKPLRFAVQRKLNGIVRGHWEFEYKEKNEWDCTRAGPQYLREPSRTRTPEPDPRETDVSRIPNDIELKAKEFLSGGIKLNPRNW